MKPSKHIRTYVTVTGKTQFKPSIQLCMALNHRKEGFCLGCGAASPDVEPDAEKRPCPFCGAPKVYGFEQLVLKGLTFEA